MDGKRTIFAMRLCNVIALFVVNWIEWARGVEPAPSAYTDEK